MSCKTAGDRLARKRYLIEQKCTVIPPVPDPIQDFKNLQNCVGQAPFYEIITAGAGISLSEKQLAANVKAVDVRITPVGTAGTYTTPSNITVNDLGQVLSIVPAPPQGPFTIIGVDGFDDIVIPTPYSVTSIAGDKRAWSGRWTTKESFAGTIKVSFRMNPLVIVETPVMRSFAPMNQTMQSSVSFVGITKFSSVKEKDFIPRFEAGFYFESRESFGILNTSVLPYKITKVGAWTPSDIFSITFTGKEFIYYQSGKKLLVVASAIRVPLYVAGAFYSMNNVVQTVSSIFIRDIVNISIPSANIHPIMKTTTGGCVKLYNNTLVLATLYLDTTVNGNISVWGYVDADIPLILGISITSDSDDEEPHKKKRGRHSDKKGRHRKSRGGRSSESDSDSDNDSDSDSASDSDKEHSHKIELQCDKQGTIFYGTPHHLPPKTYCITLTAKTKGAATVTGSRLMTLGNVT